MPSTLEKSKSQIVKKPKASKEKMPKGSKTSSPSHPPYFQMIKEAILALHERSGSSPRAIAKFMEEKYKGDLTANFRKVLSIQLKKLVAGGKLLKIKASFKLSDSAKQVEKKVVKDLKPKVDAKPKSATATASVLGKRKALETAKKPVVSGEIAKKVKKATPLKVKQLKSIKSPAAKKASVAKKVKKVVAVKAKQPKTIKSPAKRARKAVA